MCVWTDGLRPREDPALMMLTSLRLCVCLYLCVFEVYSPISVYALNEEVTPVSLQRETQQSGPLIQQSVNASLADWALVRKTRVSLERNDSLSVKV